MQGRQKGLPKTGGRTAGTPNKSTKEAKELLQEILFGEFDNIKGSLSRLRHDNDAKYLEALAKLVAYVLPKQTDIKIEDGNINVTFIEKK